MERQRHVLPTKAMACFVSWTSSQIWWACAKDLRSLLLYLVDNEDYLHLCGPDTKDTTEKILYHKMLFTQSAAIFPHKLKVCALQSHPLTPKQHLLLIFSTKTQQRHAFQTANVSAVCGMLMHFSRVPASIKFAQANWHTEHIRWGMLSLIKVWIALCGRVNINPLVMY